ncbi:MAG TPA: flavin reductase family protein [Elusimicrobiota bacterium]|nr:flavin reductase family protein [Elusimicrobiota bacterium]
MQLDPEALEVRDRYALMIGLIQPRPIAWVSTVAPDGATNLAPFSFFTGICANPMTLCFAPVNDRHGKKKDTLLNVEATKQFVVNIATETNAEKMNQTSAPYPYGVSEFEKAGLTPLPSNKVKPPRVAESPAAYECELVQIVRLGEGPLSGNLIIGKVVQIHVNDSIYNGGKVRHSDLKTIGRMEGAWYSRTRDAFELPRPEAA